MLNQLSKPIIKNRQFVVEYFSPEGGLKTVLHDINSIEGEIKLRNLLTWACAKQVELRIRPSKTTN